LSDVVGFGTATEALQALVEVNAVMFDGHVIIGFV
jgi:prepilin-type processing-associated H-X9-DG protein